VHQQETIDTTVPLSDRGSNIVKFIFVKIVNIAFYCRVAKSTDINFTQHHYLDSTVAITSIKNRQNKLFSITNNDTSK